MPKRATRPLIDPDTAETPVYVLTDRHRRVDGPWHQHRRLQFLHVSEGVLSVMTARQRVVIAPQRGVWVPPGVSHRITSHGAFWLTTCYIDTERVAFTPRSGTVVAVDRLTDALLIAIGQADEKGERDAARERKVAVLLDALAALETTGFVLPQPVSPRLARLTALLLDDPARSDGLAALAAEAALSERTAARLFQRETGLSFGRWRGYLRMQVALGHLSAGKSVTETALAVDYQDVSSFIEAFRQCLGETPSRILSR